MKVTHNDGGRAAYGFKGPARDCVTRSIAIASGRPYDKVFAEVWDVKRRINPNCLSPNHGVYTNRGAFSEYMIEQGWKWHQSTGTSRVTVARFSVPGCVIVSMVNHYSAMIDGVWHDRVRLTPGRQIKGYWSRA